MTGRPDVQPRTAAPPLTARGSLRWAVVEPALRQLAPRTVLELGCGQGGVGARIARRATYLGVEPDPASCAVARDRVEAAGAGTSSRVLLGDHTVVPAGATYDVVCAFEVLEHLADDAGELGQWVRLVRPGGHFVCSVPEGPQRFGASDTMVGHHRRYTATTLRALLDGVGLVDARVRHYGWPVMYLLEAANNRVSQRQLDAGTAPGGGTAERGAASGRWLQPSALVGAALRVAVAPGRISQRLLPGHGPGLVAVARRA